MWLKCSLVTAPVSPPRLAETALSPTLLYKVSSPNLGCHSICSSATASDVHTPKDTHPFLLGLLESNPRLFILGTWLYVHSPCLGHCPDLSWCMQGHVWSRRGSIPGGVREMSSELSGGP